jgi:stearoyl-CoA desaturase (delta-9 desaturase)
MRHLSPDELELDIPGGETPLAQLPSGVRVEPVRRMVDLVFAVIVTFAPPISFVLALWLHLIGWYRISWIEIAVTVLMWFLAIAGVELGYHRLFAHNSYKASSGLRVVLAIMGSFAFQGPVIWWVAVHRKHHRHSDRPGDPHSMYCLADGRPLTQNVLSRAHGFLHSHMGWIWTPDSIRSPGWARYVRDLYRDASVLRVHMSYFQWLALGFVIPAVIAGLAHGSWKGVFLGLLWGGFVRVFFTNHLSYWGINTWSHSIGPRPYVTADNSTNSIAILFAIPTFGQSYHNNHHAFPGSSRMSHRRYEWDIGNGVLCIFERLGWVKDRRYPSARQIALKSYSGVSTELGKGASHE